MIAGVLLVLGARSRGSSCASGCCRSTASATPPARIAGGDLSHRVAATDPRTEVGRLGLALNRMLDRLEEAFAERRRRARTGCASSSPTPRTSCARRWPRSAATPSCSAWAPRASPRTREGDAADRGRGGAHGRARRGPADARAARRGRRRPARRARPRRSSPATPSTTRARPRPTARSASAATGRRSCSATPTSCARCSATSSRNALVHTPAGTPIEVVRRRARTARSASRCATTAPACRPTTPTRCSSASGAPRAAASAARAAPASGWRSWPAIVDAHGGRVRAANADGGGAAFVVVLPAA